jgi:hypothetical protein
MAIPNLGERHTPGFFLSTRSVQAGCDMIEIIGELKGLSIGQDDFDPTSLAMHRLREAISRAGAALANYDRARAECRQLLTSGEFDTGSRREGEV